MKIKNITHIWITRFCLDW